MRKIIFYLPVLTLLLNSCIEPDMNDVRELAEKRREFDVIASQNDRLRFNNMMFNTTADSWSNLQKEAMILKTQNKIDEMKRDMAYFEKKYADKHGKAKLNELQKTVWAYEVSCNN